jgi:hypothetical protein
LTGPSHSTSTTPLTVSPATYAPWSTSTLTRTPGDGATGSARAELALSFVVASDDATRARAVGTSGVGGAADGGEGVAGTSGDAATISDIASGARVRRRARVRRVASQRTDVYSCRRDVRHQRRWRHVSDCLQDVLFVDKSSRRRGTSLRRARRPRLASPLFDLCSTLGDRAPSIHRA